MTDQHPITPPPELVQQWRERAPRYLDGGIAREAWLIIRAAQWGADQELEACCDFLDARHASFVPRGLRTARRPKPPSLKKQALDALASLQRLTTDPNIIEPLRRALESIND